MEKLTRSIGRLLAASFPGTTEGLQPPLDGSDDGDGRGSQGGQWDGRCSGHEGRSLGVGEESGDGNDVEDDQFHGWQEEKRSRWRGEVGC
uniref:Uncharacterized protein n=1 Tax=Peronospora matthiolae TaxID=2874970 RepID=A0AAV1VKU1_9STRA